MKKFIAFFLIIACLFTLAACSEDTKDTSNDANVGTQGGDVDQPAENETREDGWNAADFESFGIPDMEEMPSLAITSYSYSEGGEIQVAWEEATDLDAVTEYAEALFNKTAAENGGNYTLDVVDNAWVLDQEITSFEGACISWESLEYYVAEWQYMYNGQFIQVTIHGEAGDESFAGFCNLVIEIFE